MAASPLLSRLASTLLHPLTPQDVMALFDPVHSSRQLRGVVTAVEHPAAGTVTVRFRPGPGWHAHEAGQWARIGVDVDGVRRWRSYSLSAAAGEQPEITVRDVGLVSGTLVRRTKPGDVLFLAPPEGDFVLPGHPRPLLMLTAGSGLTPVMSMIRTLVPRRQDADVVLVHSARTLEDIPFREELAELADQFPGLTVHHRLTSQDGRLDLSGPAAPELTRVMSSVLARTRLAFHPLDEQTRLHALFADRNRWIVARLLAEDLPAVRAMFGDYLEEAEAFVLQHLDGSAVAQVSDVPA